MRMPDEHHVYTDMERLQRILAVSDTALPGDVDNVVHATTCVVDGIEMAHLLVSHGDNEYVVFLVPESSIAERSFSRDQWRGEISRVDHHMKRRRL